MNIQELQAKLKAKGVTVTDTELSNLLTDLDVKVENLSDSAIAEIANHFRPSAITTSKAGKATKTNKRSTRVERGKESAATSLNVAMTTAAQSTATELDAFVSVVDSAAGQYEEGTAQRLVDRIREVPVNVIQRVSELAAQEVADPEAFRDAARKALAGTCFAINDDAA